MSVQPERLLPAEEFLAIEGDTPAKHEFCRGEMFAMDGASREHNLITSNIAASLHAQLITRPCESYANDMRVKVAQTGLYAYPDIVVTCEKPRFEDDKFDTLLNPQVVAEVLSDSTEKYDRGKKFEHYRQIDSLVAYLLISQDRAHVELFTRDAGGVWGLREASGLDRAPDQGQPRG
ncbi:MAG: Uma2 family endonuclease [Planctomycetaceae bacterium]|nr:Uma2 family endonuclease [Planctomycetaceae bacterium]